MTIIIEATKNEEGKIWKTVKVDVDNFHFYEIIGIIELTKNELCNEENRRSEEYTRRQAEGCG